MKSLFFSLIISVIMGVHASANCSIVVVANTDNKKIQLNRLQVRNLFMGNALPYDLEAITLPPDNQTRVLFNTRVVGLTESRIQSYWAQMRFTGRKKEPKEIATERAILEYIKDNPGSVGYLPSGISIPDELTVLYSSL